MGTLVKGTELYGGDGKVWCQGKEPGRTDGVGFCRNNGNIRTEEIFPKEGRTQGYI